MPKENIDELLDDMKWTMIRRLHKISGEIIDPDRITIIHSYEESENKHGFGVLVDKKLKFTVYP